MLAQIPYHPDSSRLFAGLAACPWAAWLDSGYPHARGGRYDILAADPYLTLCTRDSITELCDAQGCHVATGDPLNLLRQALGTPKSHYPQLPFAGGAIGWFGYDLGRRMQGLAGVGNTPTELPDMAVGLYDWAIVVDHQEATSWLVAAGRDPATAQRWEALRAQFLAAAPSPPHLPALRLQSPIRSDMAFAEYATAFARIQAYIREGDCYQVNFAQRFSAAAEGDALSAYLALRRISPAPHAAYLNTPHGQVLSSSPERFLRLCDGQVEARPIKGTRPRGADPASDAQLATELSLSSKDRAENLMIVDLLRNDLGRVCRPGSIRVPELFGVESYANVHHLVSTVSGELAHGCDACDLLRASFPGGSITGAPKIRAMQIIAELESVPREVYCGAIAHLGFDGNMDSSIAIRTLAYSAGQIRCWAGGGIVHDSDLHAEYRETLVKAEAMLRVLYACAPLDQPETRRGGEAWS